MPAARFIPPFMRRFAVYLPPAAEPTRVDNTTRPEPGDVAVGTWVWNTDDNAPNWSDGTNWRDAQGNIT